MMVRALTVLSVSLWVSFCISCRSTDAPRIVKDIDYQVYSTFLNTFKFYKNIPAKGIVICDSTVTPLNSIKPGTSWSWITTHLGDRCRYYDDSVYCRKAKEPTWVVLFDAFNKPISHKPMALQPEFKIGRPIQIRSKAQLRQYFETDNSRSERLYTFYLSNITYNADHTKALFFSSFTCDGNCGRGN